MSNYESLSQEELKDITDRLREIRDTIVEQVNELDHIVNRELRDNNADAYLVAPLKIHASEDNYYVTRDMNIDKLIKRVEEAISGESDEDDEVDED